MAKDENPANSERPDEVTAVAVAPDRIFELATGFMAAKHLFAASELGVFDALAQGPAPLEELARRTRLSRRTARISADAMVALGLLEWEGDAYRNGEVAAAFLAGGTVPDLRPFLRFWDQISYPAWLDLVDVLSGGPHSPVELDEAKQEVFSAGVEAIQASAARVFATIHDFTSHHRLLDVGGGTGSWSAAVVRRHRHMSATVVDLPAVANLARQRIAAQNLSQRIAVGACDIRTGTLPEGHDVVLVANLVHYFSPEQNLTLLRRVRDAVERGARLLVADFWTDRTHTQPLMAALMAGEFAVVTENGDVYSVEEACRWLDTTGWRFIDQLPLAGPVSLVVAEAI